MGEKTYDDVKVPPLIELKRELKEACEKQAKDGRAYIGDFFGKYRGLLPKEMKGDTQRTYGFEHATSIIKTFGAEGVKMYHAAYPRDTEIEAACLVALNKELKDVCQEVHADIVRRKLVTACDGVVAAVKDYMSYEKDPNMHHSLTVLRDECNWCIKEHGDGAQ